MRDYCYRTMMFKIHLGLTSVKKPRYEAWSQEQSTFTTHEHDLGCSVACRSSLVQPDDDQRDGGARSKIEMRGWGGIKSSSSNELD